MNTQTRKKILVTIGYAISVLLIYLAFRKVAFDKLWLSLRTAQYLWILPNLAVVLVSMWYRAYRWRLMVNPVKELGMDKLFASTMIGFMASNVLPLRLGEFVRAWSLGRIADVSRTAVLATVVVERIFDSFALLTFMTVILLLKNLPLPSEIEHFGYIFLVINVAALAVLVLLGLRPAPTLAIIKKVLSILPTRASKKIYSLFEKFTQGLRVMGDFKVVLRLSLQSLILWFITGASNYFVFLAFDLDLPLDASFLVLVIVSIGIMIPQSPGFVGGYHICVWYALKPYGIDKDVALAVAVVLHGAQYVLITLVGFFYLRREHLSLKQAEVESIVG